MGKTFTSYLISNSYNNIILFAPLRQLVIQLLDEYDKYTSNQYNKILISLDGIRNNNIIVEKLKDRNIIASTYKSVDIVNNIINKLNNVIIVIDEYHNLSNHNINSNEDEMNKLLYSDHKILYLSATPLNRYNYKWSDAINNNYINDFEIFLPSTYDKILLVHMIRYY